MPRDGLEFGKFSGAAEQQQQRDRIHPYAIVLQQAG